MKVFELVRESKRVLKEQFQKDSEDIAKEALKEGLEEDKK